MNEPPPRPRSILPPGSYIIRLHLNGETASIARHQTPDDPLWVGGWAVAAAFLQDLDERTDGGEPLTWKVTVSIR